MTERTCAHMRIKRNLHDDFGILFDECAGCDKVYIYGPDRVWLARKELREALAERKSR